MTAHFIGLSWVLLAVLLEACGQTSLKNGANQGTNRIGKKSWIVIGISCFMCEAIAWTMVLRLLDVSIAYPLGSLSFVGIVLLSRLFLKERLSRQRWAGVILILCGTGLVGLH
jgi:multidrug transporter EmrE-like cation transporter